MRRFISIFVVVLTVLAVANAGVREDFKANPKLSANNYQAYPTSGFPALTAAPDGYEPFFINHYGRHGSRWLIQEKKYTYPLQMLEKGERTVAEAVVAPVAPVGEKHGDGRVDHQQIE